MPKAKNTGLQSPIQQQHCRDHRTSSVVGMVVDEVTDEICLSNACTKRQLTGKGKAVSSASRIAKSSQV